MARKVKTPARRRWVRMERGSFRKEYLESAYPDGPEEGVTLEVWANDLYEAVVEHHPDGWSYITLKRYDRHVVRDWRHLQSIKNEIVGPEREAFELFPAESRLMDTSNQFHLWVIPEGEMISVGQPFREIAHPEDVKGIGKARQRAWQPGLSTGPQERE